MTSSKVTIKCDWCGKPCLRGRPEAVYLSPKTGPKKRKWTSLHIKLETHRCDGKRVTFSTSDLCTECRNTLLRRAIHSGKAGTVDAGGGGL